MRGKEKRPLPQNPAEFAVVSLSILPNFFLAPLCFSPSKRTLKAEETLKAHIRLTGVPVARLKACRGADSRGSAAKYRALPCLLLFSVNSMQTTTRLGRGNHQEHACARLTWEYVCGHFLD